MSPFEYSQLDPDESEFRLLQVHPAKLWADPLICTIVQRPLGLKQVVPQYGALSYCWENQRATEEIELDGRPHLISKTVHSFLRQRRQNSPSVFCVWIDAICINQSDDEEKADQIGLMRQIYTDADELLIWLGEGSNSSDLAMDTMENLGRSPNLRPWTMSEEEIEAMSGLMERPWWFRIWIVQEVVLGAIFTLNRPAYIMCGGRKVDYSGFMAGVGRLKLHTKESRQLFHFVDVAAGLDDARTREVEASDNDEQASRRSLLRLLAETRSRLATDPRDKIYGILGLVDPQDTLAQYVKADYTKTAAKLYQELATQALQTLPGLQILRYCGRQELLDLPSWVPDWSTDIHEHHLWNKFDMEDDESSEYDVVEELTGRSIIFREIPKDRKHYAAFDHFDQVPIYLSPGGKKLHLLGIVWDTIVTTHAPFVGNVTEPWENATHFMLQVAKCKALVEGSTALPNP